MAYKGNTSTVTCDEGGLTGASNIDSIASNMMLYPSRNLLLEKRGRRKRGGTAHVYEAALGGGEKILGLYDAVFDSGTQHLIIATANGDVYVDGVSVIASNLGGTNPYSFAMGENKVFIANGASAPYVWAGTGEANEVAEPAVDWTTSPPFQVMLHTRGLLHRMCALNRRSLYLSKAYTVAGDMEYFETGGESIYLDTGDGYGIVGMVEIGEEIVLFGRHKAYRVDDADSSVSNWGLIPVQWDGGAASWRLIVKIPNDVICMSADGEIYSIRAVADYGDYKLASLTKDSWMHDYIKTYVNLSQVNNFHAKFFPKWRAVVFFVATTGSTACNAALIYYIDREPKDAWMIHNNDNALSGYNACASEVVERKSDGAMILYTGDYAGNVWELDKNSRNDNGGGYYAGFKTSNDAMGDPRQKKLFYRGQLSGEPFGDYALNVAIWIDGEYFANRVVPQLGSAVLLDDFMLDDDFLAGGEVVVSQFPIGRTGYRIQYEIFNTATDQDFFINTFSTDCKLLGPLQK